MRGQTVMTADSARLVCAVRLQLGMVASLDDLAHAPRLNGCVWEMWCDGRYIRMTDLLKDTATPGRAIDWPISSSDELLGERRRAEAA
ncbi:hypothetical protein [Natronospira bacteriovora]|uniref:Uncharacterized protein n=1 Tax=Natronospira bacteriovora TaxID=3069753 RepID=A0ABU0W5L8_9GAMM|nr:hypothetical protein [Natronospira sp. AB-CW4]MDQ2069286.1 hypothetical protein [Natronospira sp. AB-CW4]